jgi:hypothetical protein
VAYAQLYLREEIQAEALVRNLPGFARFLPVAALFHAQTLSTASLARDAEVARTTVDAYLDVLEDTCSPSGSPRTRPSSGCASGSIRSSTGSMPGLPQGATPRTDCIPPPIGRRTGRARWLQPPPVIMHDLLFLLVTIALGAIALL